MTISQGILLVCGILFAVIAIGLFILDYRMAKSAKQWDIDYHRMFLEEVEELKEEHKDV